MSSTTTTTTPPAGWHQDPEDSGSERWWNGTQWTAERRPLTAPSSLRPYGTYLAPTGSAQTPWVWAIVFLPLVSLVLSLLACRFLYWPLLFAGVPEVIAAYAAFPLVLGLAWLFATQDWRVLGLRGYPRPNLAWMILIPPLAYLIVRGRGLRAIGIKSTWIELIYVLCAVSVALLNAGASALLARL